MKPELAREEIVAIRRLKNLAKRWPKTLWLFSGSGTLHVMRAGPEGEQVHTPSGGVDQEFAITAVDGILNDGGDW